MEISFGNQLIENCFSFNDFSSTVFIALFFYMKFSVLFTFFF